MSSSRLIRICTICIFLLVANGGCSTPQQTRPGDRSAASPELPVTAQSEALNVNGNVFGFADASGTRLMVVDNGQSLTRPEEFHTALGEFGAVIPIRYVGHQSATNHDNGRLTMYNFQNLGGSLFASTIALSPDQTYYLVKPTPIALKGLFQIRSGEYANADANLVHHLETRKNRKVMQATCLATWGETSDGLYFVLYADQGENKLFSIVLIYKGQLWMDDHPATFDPTSTWRVDDGGEISPREFRILFVGETVDGPAFGYTWAGAEGENANILKVNGTHLEKSTDEASRYWVPE